MTDQGLRSVTTPDIAGRRFDFPPGYNLVTRPRGYEPIGFAELRGFADAYDLLSLVIETRKDQMERQRWRIRPRDSKLKRKNATVHAAMSTRLSALESFFQKPDGATRWKTWLRSLLEDMFVIDAATLYCRRTRSGQLCALQQLDGSTIKRVIDDWGRTPQPYTDADGVVVFPPAYQQVLKGVPAADYTRDELLYLKHNPRSHKVYGYSHVEQVLVTVNILIRRALHQLEYYREGSQPDAFIGLPKEWNQDQIVAFQKHFDAILACNLGLRRRVRIGAVCASFFARLRRREKGLSVDVGDRAAPQRGDAARPRLARSVWDRGLLPHRRRSGAARARAGAGRPPGQ